MHLQEDISMQERFLVHLLTATVIFFLTCEPICLAIEVNYTLHYGNLWREQR